LRVSQLWLHARFQYKKGKRVFAFCIPIAISSLGGWPHESINSCKLIIVGGLGLLTVLLAEGLNLGLSKMAEATNTHDYMQLSRLSRWHIESDAINRALAMVIDAQAGLPMAKFWGGGVTASSDGQFFPAARQGEAMNLINAKYGSEPGLKAYTHVSDQFGPFATQNIPATVSEAPYILDGLLMNEAEQPNPKHRTTRQPQWPQNRPRWLSLADKVVDALQVSAVLVEIDDKWAAETKAYIKWECQDE